MILRDEKSTRGKTDKHKRKRQRWRSIYASNARRSPGYPVTAGANL